MSVCSISKEVLFPFYLPWFCTEHDFFQKDVRYNSSHLFDLLIFVHFQFFFFPKHYYQKCKHYRRKWKQFEKDSHMQNLIFRLLQDSSWLIMKPLQSPKTVIYNFQVTLPFIHLLLLSVIVTVLLMYHQREQQQQPRFVPLMNPVS